MTTTESTPSLLSRPGARALLTISTVARLPLAMLSIALLVHAQRLTGSFAVGGLVTGAYAVCAALTAPLLGRVVDRHGQTRTLLTSSALTSAMLLCTGLMPADAPAAVLVGLGAILGLSTPPLPACVRALLPAIASSPSDLPRLFALESTVLELTFVLGPPLALGLGALWSTGGALIVCAAVMFAGTAAFAAQSPSRAWRSRDRDAGHPGGALRCGAIRALVQIELATGVVFGATEVGVTATAKHLAGATAAAPLLALWGVGSLLGGIVATRAGGPKQPRTLIALLAALALLHGGLIASTSSLPLMGVIILLAGATIAPTSSGIYALVDRATPAGTQIEGFSWLYTASASGAALGAAVAGSLAQRAGVDAVFAFAGGAGALAVAVALVRGRALSAAAAEPVVGAPAVA